MSITGTPSQKGLDAFVESFLRFLEQEGLLDQESEETADQENTKPLAEDQTEHI